MSQKLHVDGFKWVEDILMKNLEFIKLIKNYDGESDEGYILEVDVEYPKSFHNLHNDLPFLPERVKINEYNKLGCNLHDKKLCCSHNSFKTSIKSFISFEKSSQNNSI